MQDAQIALNRFGLGAKHDEAPPSDPRAWIAGQLRNYDPLPAGFDGLIGTPEAVEQLAALRLERKDARKARDRPASMASETDTGRSQPVKELLRGPRDSY